MKDVANEIFQFALETYSQDQIGRNFFEYYNFEIICKQCDFLTHQGGKLSTEMKSTSSASSLKSNFSRTTQFFLELHPID